MNRQEFEIWAAQQRQDLSNRHTAELDVLAIQEQQALLDAQKALAVWSAASIAGLRKEIKAIHDRQSHPSLLYRWFGYARRDAASLYIKRSLLAGILAQQSDISQPVTDQYAVIRANLVNMHALQREDNERKIAARWNFESKPQADDDNQDYERLLGRSLSDDLYSEEENQIRAEWRRSNSIPRWTPEKIKAFKAIKRQRKEERREEQEQGYGRELRMGR